MRLGKYLSWVNDLHWGHLRALGNSRLVRSSIAWLFIVPIAAKLFAPFAGQHTLDLSWFDRDLNEAMVVTIALPFSWKLFYLMSCVFFIGLAVYRFACPEIVRKYANYGDYRRDHLGPTQMSVFLSAAFSHATEAACESLLAVTRVDRARMSRPDAVFHAIVGTRQSYPRRETEGTDIRQDQVFHALLTEERRARRFWLWVSGVFFACGLVLFAWVVLEGVVEVFKLL